MDLLRRCQAAMLALALAAAHVPAAAATAAAAPRKESARSGWVEHRTLHFTALSKAAERRTLDILHRLERFRQVLSILYPKMRVEAPVETLVLVFRDHDSMAAYAPRFEGRPVEIEGMFQAGRDANVILVNGSSQGDPLPIIYHEYMHFFTQLNFPPLPVWFNEGLAECYTTFRADENTAEVGRPIEDHVAYLRSSILLPLKELFTIGRASTEYNEGERRGVFYAQSWAITHYLMWDNPDRRPQLGRFLELIGNGRAPEDAFTEAFDIDLATFEAEMKRHIGQNRFHHTIARFKEQAFDQQATTRALSEAEAASRLAEAIVWLDPRRAGEARAVLAPALTATPQPASAWRALGRIQAAEGANAEALQAFGRAFEADQGNAVSALLYGEALMAQGGAASTARARDVLGKAVESRPAFTEAAVSYGRAILVSPESITRAHLDRAIGALEQTTGGAWRGGAAITLAYLYASRGDLDRAETFARNVLPHAATAAEVESVRGFIGMLREQDAARRLAAEAAEEPPVAADPPPLAPKATVPDPRPVGDSPAGSGRKVPAPDEEEIRRLQSVPPHALRDGDCISVFNEAAALGNARRYKEALALVDRLLPGCAAFPEIKAQITDLATRMRRDATRAGLSTK